MNQKVAERITEVEAGLIVGAGQTQVRKMLAWKRETKGRS
jgi:hypothetical protein